jgi:transcription elongation factor GreB
MSKAFTRESDDAPEPPARPPQLPSLPPGAKNYLTPDGARRLKSELERLTQIERPKLAAANDADSRRQLPTLDRLIQHLMQSLATAVVVVPPEMPWEQVRFGATVTVRNHHGEETRYRLVGIDETDLDRDWISWLAPIARALLNTCLGQRVRFKFPSSEEDLEIVRIEYE